MFGLDLDEREKNIINSIFYIIYFVCFILIASYFINNDALTVSSAILLGSIFFLYQLLLLYTTNNYFKSILLKKREIGIEAISIYIIKEFFAVFTAFLTTVIFMAFELTLHFYVYIFISFVIGLSFLILFYYFEKCWFKSIPEVRVKIDSNFNIENIINIITGICTLFVFVAQSTKIDNVLIFTVLAVVYTYYIYFNFINIKIKKEQHSHRK